MSEPRRYAALRGKITPNPRNRTKSADAGGTVFDAQGRAKERGLVDELERASHSASDEHELASEVSERIRTIISSAEAAANAVRHEADQKAQVKRRAAEEEARLIVDDARREAEAYLAQRVRRISELSDAIVERAESILTRLDRATEVRRQLQGLADSLGDTAERMARELAEGELPTAGERAAPAPAAPEPQAAPARPEPAAEAAAPEPVVTAPAEPETAASEAAPAVEPEAAPVEPEAAASAEPEASAPEAEAAPAAEPEPSAPEASEDAGDAADPAGPTIVQLAEQRREPDEQLNARLVALQMAVAGGSREEVEVHLKRNFQVNDLKGILNDVFGEDGGEPERRVARSGPSGAA